MFSLKIVQLKNNGRLTIKDKEYFGGKYSFIQRIKMNGVGSPKVIYKSGIPYFDELSSFVENEVPFVNFELMQNGLLIRLNRNQKTRIVGFRLDEILMVKYFKTQNDDNVTAQQLRITTVNEDQLQFRVVTQNIKTIKEFFCKNPLIEKFNV